MTAIRVSFCFYLMLLFIPGTTRAAIVLGTDTSAPGGENNIATDTATGLVWLDWTATDNLTYLQALSHQQPGGILAGYRHATIAEATLFMQNLGVPSASISNNIFLPDPAGDIFYGVANVVGITRTFVDSQFPDGQFFTTGTTADVSTIGAQYQRILQLQYFPRIVIGGSATLHQTRFSYGSLENSVDAFAGHALVQVATVPEPLSLHMVVFVAVVSILRKRIRDNKKCTCVLEMV